MSNKKPSKKTNASNTKKEAILLLGHGSRVPDAARNMQKTAERLKEKHGYALVEICFMSRLGPHFPEVFEKCVLLGATKVLVIPYFLHMGLHLFGFAPLTGHSQDDAARRTEVSPGGLGPG